MLELDELELELELLELELVLLDELELDDEEELELEDDDELLSSCGPISAPVLLSLTSSAYNTPPVVPASRPPGAPT